MNRTLAVGFRTAYARLYAGLRPLRLFDAVPPLLRMGVGARYQGKEFEPYTGAWHARYARLYAGPRSLSFDPDAAPPPLLRIDDRVRFVRARGFEL